MIKDIYSDPSIYDHIHWWKTNDIEFIVGLVNELGHPVLELAAGTGRLALPIMENGITYHGIDSSPEYVSWSQKKLAPYETLGKITVGDMRSLELDQQFKTAFIGFNSIFHLMTNDDISRCFSSVFDHLEPGGHFVVDMFLPDPSFLHREPIEHDVMEFTHPELGPCRVRETNVYDDETQINAITWYFYYENQAKPHLYSFNMHMIYPDTMFRLLNEAGFHINQVWGDYDKSPMDEDSRLQFYLCQKPDS